MKLCLVGNSHVAGMIAAHPKSARKCDLTVFAKPGLAEGEACLEGTILVPHLPALAERLIEMKMPIMPDLAACDAVAFVALMPSVFGALRLVQGRQVSAWPSGQRALSRAVTADKPLGRPLISRSFLRAALQDATERSLAFLWASQLRQHAGVPIFVLPQPFPSALAIHQNRRYPLLRRVVRSGDGPDLARDLEAAHRAAFSKIENINYLPQPEGTTRKGCLTDPAFMRGSVRLHRSGKQPKNDILHANPELGQRYFEEIFSAIV